MGWDLGAARARLTIVLIEQSSVAFVRLMAMFAAQLRRLAFIAATIGVSWAHHESACDACCACKRYTNFAAEDCRYNLCGDGSGMYCWDPDPWSLASWGQPCTEVRTESERGGLWPACEPPAPNLGVQWSKCQAQYVYFTQQKHLRGTSLRAFHNHFFTDVCGKWLSDLKRKRRPSERDFCYFKGDLQGYRDRYAIYEAKGSHDPQETMDATAAAHGYHDIENMEGDSATALKAPADIHFPDMAPAEAKVP